MDEAQRYIEALSLTHVKAVYFAVLVEGADGATVVCHDGSVVKCPGPKRKA